MNRPAYALFCMLVFSVAIASSASLHAQAAPANAREHAHAQTLPSTSITLNLNGKATTLSMAELQAMSKKTVTVHNEHSQADETYSGVPLSDLLAKYGLPADKTTHRKMLHSYLTAEGTDKYWVLYSILEIEPSAHNSDVIVATTRNGKPLTEDGAFKLIDTADKKPQRWVRNLSAITVKSAE